MIVKLSDFIEDFPVAEPKFSRGQVLVLTDKKTNIFSGLTPGSFYVKILSILWESMEYHIQLYNKDMSIIVGSSHRIPICFIDEYFKPDVAKTMKSIYDRKKKR